jgi:hypothetical protein
LAALRALPRLAELCSFVGFCAFDRFLRLAMIDPPVLVATPHALKRDHQVPATDPTSC